MTNKLQNTRIEFHILQSFPVSCLNRDDAGTPKSAIIGGTERARVSSQCWKRAIRLELPKYGIETGKRTCYTARMIARACKDLGATDEQAETCAEVFIKEISSLDKNVKSKVKSSALLFITNTEAHKIADFFSKKSFTPTVTPKSAKGKGKEKKEKNSKDKESIKNILEEKGIISVHDGLDIALFGRMAANTPDINVEAAVSFSHAISTHRVASEIDFFSAVDDLKGDEEGGEQEQGAGHLGSLEFNSATYYRYISLDLGQLSENLGGETDLSVAINAFTRALFFAVPTARQATMSASTLWNYAQVYVRQGHRIQANFEEAVRPGKNGIVAASKEKLKAELKRIQGLCGKEWKIFAQPEIGENPMYSIDDLITDLNEAVQKILANQEV